MPKKSTPAKGVLQVSFFLPPFAGIIPSRFIGFPAPISLLFEIGTGFSASGPPYGGLSAPLAYSSFQTGIITA
jgi:hypothetical protein